MEATKRLIKHHKYLLFVVLAAVLVLGFNSLNYPYFEGDEGIYMSRALNFYKTQTFTEGTYWYDHPPLGWIVLSIPLLFQYFDSVLISGRLFIILIAVINSVFIYGLTYYLTSSRVFGVLSALLFILSPLEIYFGRRILLDNIMIFWVLASLVTYYYLKNRWLALILSAVFFAFSILTKENAILYVIPIVILLYYVPKEDDKTVPKRILVWLAILSVIVAIYPLYAHSRNELLPNNYFQEGGSPSLSSTLIYQANRSKSAVFDFEANPFWDRMKFWSEEDPVMIGFGILSALFNLYIGIRKKYKAFIALPMFVIVQLLFFMRGGVVFEFYILSLIPFCALNIALSMYYGFSFLDGSKYRKEKLAYLILPILSILAITSLMVKNKSPFTSKQTDAQFATINWLKDNQSDSSFVITDSFALPDLRNSNINARSQYDAEYNPNFRDAVTNKELKVKFIVETPQYQWDKRLTFVKGLLENSTVLHEFTSDSWNVKIHQVNEP